MSLHRPTTEYGLRDYGTGRWEGGEEGCDHKPNGTTDDPKNPGSTARNGKPSSADREILNGRCPCGARRVDSQVGLEPTPAEYVARLVAVFAEVRRILRDDGTLFLNIGDSYGPGKQLQMIPARVAMALQRSGWTLRSEIVWAKPNPMPESVSDRPTKAHEMLYLFCKSSDCGGRFAHVADDDARWVAGLIDCEGCIVVKRCRHDGRADTFGPQVSIGSTCRALVERVAAIFGHGNILQREGKNAPMYYWQVGNGLAADFLRRIYPFLVVKQRQARIGIHVDSLTYYRGGKTPARKRRSDAENAVLVSLWDRNKACNHFGEPDLSDVPEPEFLLSKSPRYYFDAEAIAEPVGEWSEKALRSNWKRKTTTGAPGDRRDNTQGYGLTAGADYAGFVNPNGTRNRRSVWTVTPDPYPGAHFAVMPPELVRPCVLAGTSERGCCPACGAPWVRVVASERVATRPGRNTKVTGDPLTDGNRDPLRHVTTTRTTGWAPSCACPPADPTPCLVLDPFAGSGTTLAVAVEERRAAVGIELNPAYVELIHRRLRGVTPSLV